MGVLKVRRTGDHLHAIPRHVRTDQLDLTSDYRLAAIDQVVNSDIMFDVVALAVKPALPYPREVHDGFAQSFARDGSGVDADTAQRLVLLNESDLLAELCSLYCGALAGGAAADN